MSVDVCHIDLAGTALHHATRLMRFLTTASCSWRGEEGIISRTITLAYFVPAYCSLIDICLTLSSQKLDGKKVKTNSNPISECFLHVHKEIPVVRCKFFCLSTRVVCFLALFCTSKLRLGEQLLQALYGGCVWPLSEGERHRLLQRSPSQHCLPLSITLQVLFSTADTHKTHTRTQCSSISPELNLVTPQPTRVHVHGAV